MTEQKDKGEFIRGRDLKITERDIINSLPFLGRVRAFLFGGIYGIGDPQLLRAKDSQLPRVAVVYLPPVWMRFYYRQLYRWIHKTKPDGEMKNE